MAADRDLVNAVNRAVVVLLTAHVEGFVEDLAAEAIDHLHREGPPIQNVPQLLRALHCDVDVLEIARLSDRKARAGRLGKLFADRMALWQVGGTLQPGMLSTELLRSQMSNPGSREVARFAELLGVADLWESVEDPEHVSIRGVLNEMVGKRNAIAHGDTAAKSTSTDVDRYVTAIEYFARELDRLVAQAVARVCEASALPWAV
jgi:hypothetical protein